ncbi:hypothetical protein D3C78_97360 [compost metagenome]
MTKVNQNIVKGEWSLIQWNPDIATDEFFNIGVYFCQNENFSFKMLDYFNRVNCLYDEDTAEHLKQIIDLYATSMENGCMDFSEQIKVVNKGIAKGKDEQAILERLYSRAITLGRPHEDRVRNRRNFRNVQNDRLIKRVPSNIRRELSQSKRRDLLEFFPEDSYLDCNQNRLFVPMRSNEQFASIVSVVSPSVDTISNNYLTLATDLMTASKLIERKPNFFVLRASAVELQKLSTDETDAIDETISKLDFKFKSQGLEIETADCEEELNDKIIHWAERQKAA